MIRGAPAIVVMRPNAPELKFAITPPAFSEEPGMPQLKLLNKLNAYKRSSSVCIPTTPSCREIAMSTLQ